MSAPARHGHPHLATRVAVGGGGADARPRARWDRTPLWWIAVLFAIGSSCFLVAALASQWASVTRPASGLAYANGARAWLTFDPRSRGWWINALNLLGSIAFGVAAVASLIQPSTNEPVSAAIANGGTAAGALCFLLGALLLLPDASPRPDGA